jgi:hypothetical protein
MHSQKFLFLSQISYNKFNLKILYTDEVLLLTEVSIVTSVLEKKKEWKNRMSRSPAACSSVWLGDCKF